MGGFERFSDFGCLETATPQTAKSPTPSSPSGGLSLHLTRLGDECCDVGDGGDVADGDYGGDGGNGGVDGDDAWD